MSTRCNIAVVLKDEDLNKNLNLIKYAKEIDFNLDRIVPSGHIPSLNKSIEEIFEDTISTNKRVLQIYCHHDGYPTGVGEDLINHFNTYEEALALVLAGDTSGLDENKTHVYSIGEGYDEHNKPSKLDKPTQHEMYLYYFEDGEWKIDGRSLEDILKIY